MSAQQSITTEPRSEYDRSLPAELNSPRAKLIYLHVATIGETTVDEIQDTLDIKKITLFSILGTLSKQGLVETAGTDVALA
jgi:predicted transcriptional regulator